MPGAFSASASAEAEFTWTGDVTGSLIQTSTKAETTGDSETLTYMDMVASADLELSVKVPGDVWTGEAKFELDLTAGNTEDDNEEILTSAVNVDDLYVVASKEGLAITFGEFDPFGIGKGGEYLGEIDDTEQAGGFGAFSEKGLAMVGLTDVGLNLILGMNKVGDADDKEVASETLFGANFDKAFGDLAFAVSYYSASRSINEDDGDATKDSDNDGYSASEISLAVQYTLGQMAFALNYTQYNDKDGGPEENENKDTYMGLMFDMGLDDGMGLSVAYETVKATNNTGATNAKDIDTDKTLLNVTFQFMLGPVTNYVAYQATTSKKDIDDNEAGTTAKLGYSMRVAF